MKIAVGSKNPVKIASVKAAFETVWPEKSWEVEGVEVNSGVSNQPKSDIESIRGATTRARKSIKELKADFGVGLEGGIHKIGKKWFDSGWVVIIDKNGSTGIGSSIKMRVPRKVLVYINEGKELGEAIDIVFKTQYSKQKNGHFGLMTKNAITRTSGYRDAVIAALARFINPDVFK